MSLFSCAIAEAGIVSISGILHMVVNLFAVVVDSDSRCPHAVEHADKWIPRLYRIIIYVVLLWAI
jgi:hypothetical protein